MTRPSRFGSELRSSNRARSRVLTVSFVAVPIVAVLLAGFLVAPDHNVALIAPAAVNELFALNPSTGGFGNPENNSTSSNSGAPWGAPHLGVSLSFLGCTSVSHPSDCRFNVSTILLNLACADFQFKLMTSGLIPLAVNFTVSLLSQQGQLLAIYDSAHSNWTWSGLGPNLIGMGGWVTGSAVVIVAGDILSLPGGATLPLETLAVALYAPSAESIQYGPL